MLNLRNKQKNSYLPNFENNSWLGFLMFQPKNFYSTKEGEKNEVASKGDENLKVLKSLKKQINS